MIKILRILNRLNVGGPVYNVANLSELFLTKILTGKHSKNEKDAEYIFKEYNISYEYVPYMEREISFEKDIKAYFFIKKYIKNYGPDIVHTHAAKAGALGRIAAWRAGVKIIVHTYHGNVFDGYFSPFKSKVILAIERFLATLTTAIIAISEKQKEDLVNKYKIASAEKIFVVPLGFDLKKFNENQAEKRFCFRKEFNIDESTIVIATIGRITQIKNHKLFIDSLGKIKKKKINIKWKAIIVGNGELLEEISVYAKKLGISICLPDEHDYEKDLIFTSWRNDIDKINAGSDIIALTSFNEGTPVSLIEGLASGKVVISTNVGGVPDVITDKRNGILTNLDSEEFSVELCKLIVDSELREKLSSAGQEKVMKKYSKERLLKDIEKLYTSLLSREK